MQARPNAATVVVALVLALAGPGAKAQTAEGEVRKIDKAQGKITLKHGEIATLDMPPMTMVYRVQDPKMLDALAVGDKVLFEPRKVDGQYTITVIRKP